VSWLPQEVVGTQPYSMWPLVHRVMGRYPSLEADVMMAFPPVGTFYSIDLEAQRILGCLIAPPSVQRAARKAGINMTMVIKPKGIERFLSSKLHDLRPEPTQVRRLARDLSSKLHQIGQEQ
jgi:hypothetical protein